MVDESKMNLYKSQQNFHLFYRNLVILIPANILDCNLPLTYTSLCQELAYWGRLRQFEEHLLTSANKNKIQLQTLTVVTSTRRLLLTVAIVAIQSLYSSNRLDLKFSNILPRGGKEYFVTDSDLPVEHSTAFPSLKLTHFRQLPSSIHAARVYVNNQRL